MTKQAQEIADIADDKIALAIDALETALIYNDELTDEEREDLQDLVDSLEDVRGVINA